MAANMLHGVTRTTADGWQLLGGRTVELFNEGQASVNLWDPWFLVVGLLVWMALRRRR
jgi:hypothetical protein